MVGSWWTSRRIARISAFVVSIGAVVPRAQSDSCAIAGFVPFTYNGTEATEVEDYGINRFGNLGFNHLAAAVLAMEHFNARDSSVVPEIADLGDNCNLTFDMENSYFFDTGIYTHQSTEQIQQHVMDTGVLPCAIAGPHNDLPAQVLGAFAASVRVPLVAHRGYNLRVAHSFYTPYSNQVYPDQVAMVDALMEFLPHTTRTNYIAILYSALETSSQRQESLSLSLEKRGVTYRLYPFEYERIPGQETDKALRLETVLQNFRDDGFRTVVVMMEFAESELQLIADAADLVGVNTEDYFWIFAGGIDLSAFALPPVDLNHVSLRFLAGSAMLAPLEGFHLDPENDPFAKAWRSQNESLVAKVNAYNPIEMDQPGYFSGRVDYFQKFPPDAGSGFLYDAMMTIGLGACVAEQYSSSHLDGIRAVNFTGSTGRVRLGTSLFTPGGRKSSDTRFGIVNLFHRFAEVDESEWSSRLYGPNGEPLEKLYQISAVLDSKGGPLEDAHWTELVPFIYRSGKQEPPELLCALSKQNYLNTSVRALGLTFMTIALIGATLSFLWVWFCRHHIILRRAQPFALLQICFGSFVIAWSIFPLSFDESYGWTESELSRGCMSVPWLVSFGHIITYGALFAKLWRLNRVLQFRRVRVDMLNVAWPAALLVLLAMILLIIMTVKAPLEWGREEIDKDTCETIGRCNSDWFGVFIWPLSLIMLVPTILTGLMAWKTQDVDTSYSDSFWVGVLIIVQIEVVLIGVPVGAVLRDVSTNGRYFGIVALLFTFPASTLCLIILPKAICYCNAKRGRSRERSTRGTGGRGECRVTGLQQTNQVPKTPLERIGENAQDPSSLEVEPPRNDGETK